MPAPYRLASIVVLALLSSACAGPQGAMVRPGGAAHPSDPAGLFERIAAGNIDSPGSQAWRRWGEGYDAWLRASDLRFERVR